jgi:hypothetical protein
VIDEQLRVLALQYGGSLLEALLRLHDPDGGVTSAALAEQLGVTRQALEEACQATTARTPSGTVKQYAHIRRSIEAQMGLSQYLLDSLLPTV